MKVEYITKGARMMTAGTPKRPIISIVTPTYCRNAEGLLTACLASASAQTFKDHEHIIIDDGSTDGSEQTILEHASQDPRIVYVRHDKNSGLPAIRTNEGILKARGDAVAFLFDDNTFEPDFLELAWDALESSGADVVYSNVEMLVKDGNPFKLGNWPISLELLRNLNTIPNGGVLVRRDFFDRFGLYDPHILMRRICDWDLWLRALWLGARFHHLDYTSATEHGLVSPNSLGNTIAWDVKVAYAYMMNSRTIFSRTQKLKPDQINHQDFLDTSVVLPYVRNEEEWENVVSTVYTPFLSKHPVGGFDPTKFGNRSASLDPLKGWNPSWSIFRPRKRVLIVSNSINAWADLWIDALAGQSGTISLNCPEWQLSAFKPADLDCIILLDCEVAFLLEPIRLFKEADVPVIYIAAYGIQAPTSQTAVADFAERSFQNCEHVISVLGWPAYFPQVGLPFSPQQRERAISLAKASTLVFATSCEQFDIGTSWVTPVVLPRQTHVLDSTESRRRIIFGSCVEVEADERFLPPFGDKPSANSSRRSFEGLGAIARCNPGAVIFADPEVVRALPEAELAGISHINAATGSILVSTEDGKQMTNSILHDPIQLRCWTTNVMKSARIAALLRHKEEKDEGPIRVIILLNSEMISGSEVYGLMLARNLARVGFKIDVVVPEETPYDEDLSAIDAWLERHALSPARRVPYHPGRQFIIQNYEQRALCIEQIAQHLKEASIVICAGFMPDVIETCAELNIPSYTALFQPSAYSGEDVAYLRGKIWGFMSDSAWSLEPSARILNAPARVVRSSYFFDDTVPPVVASVRTSGRIRIAVGGTVQPRKRQLEAIEAVMLLRARGFDLELNIYGYELDMLQEYMSLITSTISNHHLVGIVNRHGLVSIEEIISQNDIILSVSLDESLPQTLLAGMYGGLIGVAGLSGGIDELIIDSRTGYVTEDLSVAGIAAVLVRSIEARLNWPDIAREANLHISENFNASLNTSILLDVVEEGLVVESGIHGRLRSFESVSSLRMGMGNIKAANLSEMRIRSGNPHILDNLKSKEVVSFTTMLRPIDIPLKVVENSHSELRSHFEEIREGRFVKGWADLPTENSALNILLEIDGRAVGIFTADLYRTDLFEARIGDGRRAFLVQVPYGFIDGHNHTIALRLATDGRELAGSPKLALLGNDDLSSVLIS